jgi:hypothetical protein
MVERKIHAHIPIKEQDVRIKDKETRHAFAEFCYQAETGSYGTTKREIKRAAKEKFGSSPDWAAILALLMQFLPMILWILQNY